MIKPLKAFGALLALLALLAGIPAGLLVFYGNPIPSTLPSGSDITTLLTSRDTLGALLFVLVWIGWIAWATFALSVVIELVARARHIQAPQIRGLGAQQGAAALLIAAIAGGVGAPAAMAAPAPTEHAPAVQTETLAMPTETTANEDHTTPDATDEEAANEDLVVTVQPGDSAWDLAEKHLGDGLQWQKIITANDGRVQSDGSTIHIGNDLWLETGWELVIPGAGAAETAAAEQQEQTLTVQEGDTLSSIALEHLGDADRWPEIVDASADITQPNGTPLQNPDQIDVGWTLQIPGTTSQSAPEGPQDAEQPSPEPSDHEASDDAVTAARDAAETAAAAAGSSPGQTTEEAPAAEESPAPTAPADTPAPESTPSTEAEDSATVPWAGVGSILAASILSAVLARRLYTQRKRRADQKIPAAAAVDLDQIRLTRIEDPTALGFVDRALRTLSALQLRDGQTLPDVRLARLTDSHLELYAADGHDLPAPFEETEDPATWLLPRTAPLAEDETIADIVAPYPALVTIGTDHDGHQILVDLEHLAALGIHASARTSMPVMRALTVSLATSQWADDLAITTVGVCPELEDALGSGRISYRDTVTDLLDSLEAKLLRDQETLTELGHDSAQHARQAQDATDLWAPEIIIIGAGLSLTEKSRLQRIVDAQPQIAVAVISSDQHTDLSEWRMHIESLEAARLEPLGLELTPQHLTDDDYERVLRALNNASSVETITPVDQSTDDVAEPAPVDAQEPQLRAVPSVRPAASILTAEQRTAEPVLPTDHPYIRVLGPVEVLGATGPLEERRIAQLTEATCYIHLNPGRSSHDFIADLWPNRRPAGSARHQLISRLRKWLGTTTEGDPYIPRAAGDAGGYMLERITSDWSTVETIAADPTGTSTEDLAEALKLVRGHPFESSGRRYSWTVTLQFTMMNAVLDIAHELARRALEASDTDTALWATQQGLLVESLHEQLWRDRLQAASRDPELHQKVTHELEAAIAALDDDYDLLPQTEALMYTPTTHRIAI
ncbi:LysM peptidoglycan-binding domain-containing protein [Brachybacterium tyrofermentans]|uniref:LysM peptidoglycan-binding domain-containing protein n=1 Tax=Brachybacterium tyrofermentans TaxID=47848 RepID=UPI003FD17C57